MKAFLFLIVFMFSQVYGQSKNDGFIYSVSGKLAIHNLNFALTHEHIMSDFGGAPSYKPKYDTAVLFRQVVPYLKSIKSQGVVSIFDCTAAYFGRDVLLLKRLAEATGMQIITNTGFYGAANDRYVPPFVAEADAAEIASVWIAEFQNGIDSTGIKPGFIKLAFDEGIPSEIDLKLFEAGLRTHLQTGLTLVVHTGNNTLAAKEQLRLLAEYKVSPAAWVWAHANNVEDKALLVEAALKGAWISLDGVKASNIASYINTISLFRERNLLHKILLSHDGNSFPRGAAIRPYDAITQNLIPALLNVGYSMKEIEQVMMKNPGHCFITSVKHSR